MADKLTIPFRGEAQDTYVVYFGPAAHSAPSVDDMQNAARRWREGHLADPLRHAVEAFFERGLVSIRVESVDSLPKLPLELLQHMGLGELQERIVRSAKHVVLVLTQDLNIPPRAGLWSGLSAALGIAEMLDGVIFDPDALRIVDREAAATWFSATGLVSASRHIIVPFSVGASGLGWMTTRGLLKFGLPDLELREIPPHLQRLGILMNFVAQFLIEEGFRATRDAQGEVSKLVLDRQVSIDPSVIRRAQGEPDRDLATDVEIRVGLRFDPTRGDFPFIQIVRPDDVTTDQGEWLYSVMRRLVPVDDVPLMAPTDTDELTAAHERAAAELPQIRARFQQGLRPGEVLLVKHGFPTPDEGHEYMWVTVTKWNEGKISGQLSNIPSDVPSLRLGQMVTISESDVFDWMLRLAHGETEGGYTNAVVMKQSEGR